jgi:hypothetical protein
MDPAIYMVVLIPCYRDVTNKTKQREANDRFCCLVNADGLVSVASRLNRLCANFLYSLLVPAHQGFVYRGGSIGYLYKILSLQIFVLPTPLPRLEMEAFYYSLLVPAKEGFMYRGGSVG